MATRKKYKIVLSEKYVRKSENGKEWFQFPVNISGQLVAIQTIIPLDPYTEPDMEQVRKEAYEKGYETAKHECEDCPKQAYTDAIRMEGYQNGSSDAWEAARKIGSNSMCSLEEMGFDFSQCAVDDYNPSWFVVKNYSASEAIEKIKQYEQEKEEQIQVGDEVVGTYTGEEETEPFVIIRKIPEINPTYYFGIYSKSGEFCQGGLKLKKTGRHFPEIAEVLQKMKESE